MNRSLLVALALVATAVGAAFYGRLTGAAPVSIASGSVVSARDALGSAVPAPTVQAFVSPSPAPRSPELERLEARRQLYESVDALVQAGELEKSRALLDEDQARYGDDLAPEWHDLEQSYRLIADCLERPTPALRVRAEAFVVVSQAVSLRQRVLEACKKRRP